MKNYDLTYEWLDFLASQKRSKNSILKEIKASDLNPVQARTFGDFEYKLKPSSDEINISSGAPSVASVTLKCGLNDKIIATVNFNEKYAGNLKKAYYIGSKRSGYCPKSSGTFVTRKVRNAAKYSGVPIENIPLSNHSWGTAIDFDAAANPFKKNNSSEMEKHEEFIKAFEECGFIWLGDGAGRNNVGDDMHFEIKIGAQPINYSSYSDEGDVLSQAYDYIKNIGSQAYDSLKNYLSESVDHKLFDIEDKSKEKLYEKNKKYFDALLLFLKKKLKITKPVKIILEDDEENSKKVLGRTGGYINEKWKIHIFVTGRHIKDILRSLAHELVHHHQNIRGEFDKKEPTVHGYAQSNKHLRKMEKEAYLKGNIFFRDWEDNYKYRGRK